MLWEDLPYKKLISLEWINKFDMNTNVDIFIYLLFLEIIKE